MARIRVLNSGTVEYCHWTKRRGHCRKGIGWECVLFLPLLEEGVGEERNEQKEEYRYCDVDCLVSNPYTRDNLLSDLDICEKCDNYLLTLPLCSGNPKYVHRKPNRELPGTWHGVYASHLKDDGWRLGQVHIDLTGWSIFGLPAAQTVWYCISHCIIDTVPSPIGRPYAHVRIRQLFGLWMSSCPSHR